MPRGFQRTAYTGPVRSTVVAPSHDSEDAILRARLATDNPAAFTAEARASYAAFCGITDEPTARQLHRAGVSADDVNDYTAVFPRQRDNYALMMQMRRVGLTPSRARRWRDLAAEHNITCTSGHMLALTTANLAPSQVAPWWQPQYAPLRDVLPPGTGTIDAIKAHIAPEQLQEWLPVLQRDVGFEIVRGLIKMGCLPVVAATVLDAAPNMTRNPRPLVAFTARLRAGLDLLPAHRALAQFAALCCLPLRDVKAWLDHGVPADTVLLYLAAGISLNEWENDPQVRACSEATLSVMAALNDTVPVEVFEALCRRSEAQQQATPSTAA